LSDMSGFKVRLKRSGMQMITEADGNYKFDNVTAFIPDTVEIARDGFWPKVVEITPYPNKVTSVYYQPITRIDPTQLEFTGEWWVRDTIVGKTVDSTFLNEYGDLVVKRVYREVSDTVISFMTRLTLNGAPAPSPYEPLFQYSHPGRPSEGFYSQSVFSFSWLRSYGIKSGDRLKFYGQAYDRSCAGESVYAYGVKDSIEFIMP